jgi:hypothetical protein
MQRPDEKIELFPALTVHEIEERALNGYSIFSSISDPNHTKSNY